MAILGIDWGKKHVGVSISEGITARGLTTIHRNEIFARLKTICSQEKVTLIVIGLPEGVSAESVRTFANDVRKSVGVPVQLWDETLTSHRAQELLRGYTPKQKQTKEHMVAATLILESYLAEKHHDTK